MEEEAFLGCSRGEIYKLSCNKAVNPGHHGVEPIEKLPKWKMFGEENKPFLLFSF